PLRFREIDIATADAIPVVLPEGSYAAFLHYHSNAGTQSGNVSIDVDIFNPASGEGYEVIANFEGYRVLRTEEVSYVQFTINVPTAGLYNIEIEYFPVPARGIDISRELQINGEVPFRGAELITLTRVWGSTALTPDSPTGWLQFVPATSTRPASYIRQDSRGNMIRPPQMELPRWERTYFNDRLGFFTAPYQFFFEAGENTIALRGVNEPLVMRSLTVVPIASPPSFAEFMATNTIPVNNSDFSVTTQGQWSTVRSSPSLFPIFDSSSGVTYPPSVAVITLNMIGGIPWRMPGQWIEWEVEVPEDGLYRLSISARQNYNRGFVSSRQISINGVVPFEEVEAVPFHFNNSWELITLQDEYGNDLLFPMNAGVNTVRMYVTLGELGELIDSILASIHRLNAIYREILVLTGPNPDPLRDYRIHHNLPHVVRGVFEYEYDAQGVPVLNANGTRATVLVRQGMIDKEIGVLYGLLHDMEAFLGERNEHTAIISTIITQLDLFYERPDRIPVQLGNFRQNVSAFADSSMALTEGQLDIDFFIVSGTAAELPVVRETFFTRASHELRAFAASFTHDFDSIGEVHEDGRVIEVWIPTGRDQAQVMKSMIDDTFTPDAGIGVNLRLVAHQAVLPAVVAGIGPDVVLSMPLNDPANYAFRNAAIDLSQFDGFDEVYGRFHESAWVPVRFIRGDATDPNASVGFYAVPETQNFSVMFYRHDILDDLGLEVPETWDDILAMMPLLQRNNMAIGVPPIGNPMNPDISGFLAQLYQRGGFIYNDDLSRAILDDEEAVLAFEAFTRFFTHFGSPAFFNAENRFRSGEMPIVFADFTMFNMLSVFAPEIYGLWNFALMPGHDHGEPVYFAGRGYYQVHHTVSGWGSAAMIIEASEMQEEAWEFLKWWTDTETQLRFGRELESVMGAAARFPTANVEAFQSLPWSVDQLEVLNNQRNWILGTPEVPGGYYVSRHLVNAIRRVINENLDTRETLLDFNIVINRELVNKRREFGLE
ncbi:MAG: extracellular solute-binding protein, partial [Defluviitaleaceae bacterium]|nr:extracellular solute-binding protein [Defluviitaleaceae bacterium]